MVLSRVGQPRTVVGRFLAAQVAGDEAAVSRWRRSLNGGVSGWNPDEPAVVSATCELALRDWLAVQKIDDDDTDQHLLRMATFMSGHLRKDPATHSEIYAAAQTALGRADADNADISRGRQFVLQGALFFHICQSPRYKQRDILGFIRKGETLAMQRGWSPPLA